MMDPQQPPEPVPQRSRVFATARPPDALRRYSEAERLTHWAVALAYLVLFVSGLAMFHPFFYWLSALFGTAAFMRILHPYVGVALAVLFVAYAGRLWRDNAITPSDKEWLRHASGYMSGKDEVRVEGKYNAGQKIMYWSMVVCILALLLSGILIWRPWFAHSFSIGTRQLGAVVHVIFAFVMFVGIGIHIYAAIWTRGSMRAMTQGWVTRRWARYHHPGWYEKVTGREQR
jgi:formate dehydrogenase subunit gamma